MKKYIIAFFFAALTYNFLLAQDGEMSIEPAKPAKWNEVTTWSKRPRLEDHFWRKKVRYRIDLLEKVNEPLKMTENPNLYDDRSKEYNSNKDRYEYSRGIIDALLHAYANGFMMGYLPDTLDTQLEFTDFQKKYEKMVDQGGAGIDGADADGDEFSDDDDDWDSDSGDEVNTSVRTTVNQPVGDVLATTSYVLTQDFSGIPKYLDVIENRIFDRNKSDMFFEPEYIILSAKSAIGVESPIIAFRYEDVKDTVLSKCRWKNRFNDAEYRSAKEIFELRLFDSVIYVISGNGMNSIDESEKKRLQMVEFEHTLFEY